MTIITFSINAMRGPMLLLVSGFLGESGFGNGSHFSRCARHRYFQGFAENIDAEQPRISMLSNRETVMLSRVTTSRGTADWVWVRTRGDVS